VRRALVRRADGADLCATLIHVSGIRRRSLSQFGSSHPRLSLIANAFIVGWPLLTTVVRRR